MSTRQRIMLKMVILTGSFLPLFARAHGGHEHGTVEAGTTHAGLLSAGLGLVAMMVVFVKKMKSAQPKHEPVSDRNRHV